VDTTKTITHISLCSGYEGIGLGLRRVLPNLREIAYVEREGFPIANLVAKMEAGELDQAPVHTDVKTFPYRKFRGCVDILSGGFPCQPFSAAGKRKATDDPRHLFPFIAEGIRECQPRIVFLENVAGIISAKTGDGESVLKYVLRTLEEMGYRATAGIFSAEEVGAPHQRKRVFILGMANSEDIGRRGRTHRNGDDQRGLQEQEAQEQPNLRGKTAGRSRDSRGELGNSDSQRCQGERLRGDEGEPEGSLSGRSSQELGNASDLRCQQPSADSRETGTNQSGEERRVYEPQRTGSLSRYGSQSQDSQELGNATSECNGLNSTKRQGGNTSSQSSEELANHSGERAEAGLSGSDERQEGKSEELDYCSYGWPSRPGEPQYDWEEPRVTAVADTKSQQGSPSDNGGEPRASSQSQEVQPRGGHSGSLRKSNRQAEPELGGASNGSTCGVDATANRVDRLRLLGNGVVNQTAAKAFVTLIQRVNNK